MTLVEFLLARFAHVEEAASAAPNLWGSAEGRVWYGNGTREGNRDVFEYDEDDPTAAAAADLVTYVNAGCVLEDLAAKRRIVELHGADHQCPTFDRNGDVDYDTWVTGDCSTLRLLALPYANHPAYDEAWRP